MPTNRPSQAMPSELPPLPLPIRTYQECAAIIGCHWTSIQQGEQRAFRKLERDGTMKRLFAELNTRSH